MVCGVRYAVFDVETSGLSAKRHRVLQIAVVVIDEDGNILTEWSSYVRRRFGRVGPTGIHGIRRRDLRHAPKFRELMPTLVDRFGDAIVVGHNVDFDWSFLRRAFRKAGYPLPDATRLCTLQLSRSLDPDRKLRHRLSDLCERYDVNLERAHDALADARATAEVLPHLLRAHEHPMSLAIGNTTAWPRVQS